MDIIIKPSHLPDKKFDAVINNKKTIPFGQKNYSDYTIQCLYTTGTWMWIFFIAWMM